MAKMQSTQESETTDRRTRLYLHMKKWLEKAVMDHAMIEEGDRVLVGVSGGKDSYVLLDLLDSPMVFVPKFTMMAVNIDPGFDGDFRTYNILEAYLREKGYRYVMEKSDIGPLAHSEYNRKNPCFLCSRLRRKRIFEIAGEHGFNKIAFAHHRDDIIETLLINMFYGREISTMMPNQSIFGGKMNIVRPLSYIREDLVKKYAAERAFPVTESRCPTGKSSRRNYIKELLKTLEKDNRKIRDNIFLAMSHVKPDYLPGPIQEKE
jgi:tRNA 2-thiocytidine biosynthesis protein TtcA